jgi:diadenosine tetraphosphate (Ap4A) HIT family hydrolase
MNHSATAADRTDPVDPTCTFCQRASLDIVLEETAHFFVLVDHAPLTEGHLLLVPQAHYACYGAVPAAFDDELRTLKGRVAAFLTRTYGPFVYFEHGIFRQTVYHAHLHAIPVGQRDFAAGAFAASGGTPAQSQAGVREWYATHGHYFYLEAPGEAGATGDAALFPPDMERYRTVLGQLRAAAGRHVEWVPQPMRRAAGGAKMQSVAEAWRTARP